MVPDQIKNAPQAKSSQVIRSHQLKHAQSLLDVLGVTRIRIWMPASGVTNSTFLRILQSLVWPNVRMHPMAPPERDDSREAFSYCFGAPRTSECRSGMDRARPRLFLQGSLPPRREATRGEQEGIDVLARSFFLFIFFGKRFDRCRAKLVLYGQLDLGVGPNLA